MIATRVGAGAERALLDEVARGAYRLEPFDAGDVAAARDVIQRYGDMELGLADASIVVLARRHDVRDVLTLDERHYRALRAGAGRPFHLLPADG
ncbi:MAG TPA: PIN domain-containing protein [Solirubrobacteraceae bacterium]|nr:PIN domain-containing protein [Solirubrobacteraceae bacterium]